MSGIGQGASALRVRALMNCPLLDLLDVTFFISGQTFEHIGQVPGILLTKLPCRLNVAIGRIHFHCACESKKLTHRSDAAGRFGFQRGQCVPCV